MTYRPHYVSLTSTSLHRKSCPKGTSVLFGCSYHLEKLLPNQNGLNIHPRLLGGRARQVCGLAVARHLDNVCQPAPV